MQAIDTLAEAGPGLGGRYSTLSIHGSSIANLKELRSGTVRILFVFDPGAPAFCWSPGTSRPVECERYRHAIPLAEPCYERYLKERTQEEEHR